MIKKYKNKIKSNKKNNYWKAYKFSESKKKWFDFYW